MEENHRKAISEALKGHYVSEETKRKIGQANRGIWHTVKCSYCETQKEIPDKVFKRYKRHFCGKKCYALFRSEKLSFTESNAYKGVRKVGDTTQVYHKRYVAKNPERIAHLKARRYARERNAEGSHTLEEWQEICRVFEFRCASCNKRRKLTKDHIIPLSAGGTDWIKNIQPLCRNCNSRKWRKLIYENPELLEKKEV